MKTWFLALALALLAASKAEDYLKYDTTAIKRFEDELKRLGVTVPSVTTSQAPEDDSPPIVNSPAGGFEGYWTTSQFGRPIAAFEGIPYAQPPIGPLRFKVAQPHPRIPPRYKATSPGNSCVQRDTFGRILTPSGHENCLFVNVYIPERVQRTENERLPVMFFVHGGGFTAGQGDFYKSDVLLNKDVILVTFNYRLGPLGFLTTEDDVIPGNLGLRDQVAALRWVNQNIASFGGNPNLVTVFGESAGGVGSEYLLLSPLTRGLIHRVIVMSGSTFSPWALAIPGEAREVRTKAAAHLGCPVEPSKDLLACLQNKTAEEITLFDFQLLGWGRAPHIVFKPVVEGDVPGAFLPYHPSKMFADKLYNDIPYMTGIMSEEGSFSSAGIFTNKTALKEYDERFNEIAPATLFLNKPNEKSRATLEALRKMYLGVGPLTKSKLLLASNLYTDRLFLWPLIQSVQHHDKTATAHSYVYYFSYRGSRSFLNFLGFTDNLGVSHGDDLLYFFPLPGNPSVADIRMSMILVDLYTNFARDGVPSSKLTNIKWTPTKGSEIEYLHIKTPTDIKMKKNLLPERWNFLKTVLDNSAPKHDHEL